MLPARVYLKESTNVPERNTLISYLGHSWVRKQTIKLPSEDGWSSLPPGYCSAKDVLWMKSCNPPSHLSPLSFKEISLKWIFIYISLNGHNVSASKSPTYYSSPGKITTQVYWNTHPVVFIIGEKGLMCYYTPQDHSTKYFKSKFGLRGYLMVLHEKNHGMAQ